MDTSQFCMGCMRLKGGNLVCPHCGYRNKNRSPMVLPYQAILNKKFLVGRILGKPGGFGITYLAWDLVLHTTVAIKEYFPSGWASRSPDHSTVVIDETKDNEHFNYGLEQFLGEARTLAQFNHPNIVRIREFFQQNNTAYLVMDYYEGISLEEFVRRKGGKISEQLAINILLPILDGLHEVHLKKVLHRDIKPANIYLSKGGVPILLDFGAARAAIGQNSLSISVILTAGFAPFEQYLQKAGELLGPWTDIYAYGATLYSITTGVCPQNAINRHQKDELQPPIQLVPSLTPQFSDAIMAALTLDLRQRPQTVQELRKLLLNGEVNTIGRSASITSQPLSLLPKDADLNTLPPSSSPHDELTVALKNMLPARENLKTAAVDTRSSHFVRCPHCMAANNVAFRSSYNQLHCQKCGKKMAKGNTQNDSAILNKKSFAFIAILLLAGVALMKANDKPEATPSPIDTQLHVIATMQTNETETPMQHKPNDVTTPAIQEKTGDAPHKATWTDHTGSIPPPYHRDGMPFHGRPPKSAVESCLGKKYGDTCLDKNRPDHSEGVCRAPTKWDDLACEFI